MEYNLLYLLVADIILVVHFVFAAFVIFGLIFVLLGKVCSWAWVRNPWFRWGHLASISVVILESWLGMACPLTLWELNFREKAGEATYSGMFISHWIESVLYYQAPEWVFTLCYTIFGILVIASWYWVRPRRFGATKQGDACQ